MVVPVLKLTDGSLVSGSEGQTHGELREEKNISGLDVVLYGAQEDGKVQWLRAGAGQSNFPKEHEAAIYPTIDDPAIPFYVDMKAKSVMTGPTNGSHDEIGIPDHWHTDYEPWDYVIAGRHYPTLGHTEVYPHTKEQEPLADKARSLAAHYFYKGSGSHLGASMYNVQKYVWFDGKMIVTPPQYMHDEPYHATLAQDVGYKWDDPNASIEMGYYFPDDDSLQAYHEKGQGLPSEQELKEFVRAHPQGNLETVFPKDHQASIEPEHLSEDATYPVDNLVLQHADPIAGQAAGWENQRVPFLYLPDKQYLYYGNPGDHHFGLVMKASNDHFDIWDTPHISGFLKQDGTHKIFNSMVWPNAIKPHMELLKQQLSEGSVHSGRAKQAVALFPFHKYVWADGKIAVGPRVETDSVRPWHTDLMSGMGYNYQTNMPEEWNVGYYYPHDHSTYEIDSTENVPDEYSIVKQIHNHLEDGSEHTGRSSAMEITRDNPWIRTKDGRYFEGQWGQSSHMQLMWDNHIDPEEVAEYGGGEMAHYWNSTVTSVYHPYECQAADYFIDTM